MKILVTGATGFIGSHLVERLINEKYDVVVLKRSISDNWRIKNILNEVTTYDIDKMNVMKVIESEKADLIIHLSTNYGRRGETIKEIIETNITFPSVLVDIALNNGLKGFINTDTSTDDAYTFYASTKKAFLHHLNYFYKERELKIINLQLEYVYGPKDDDSKFIPYLIKSILDDKVVDASPGMQKRDFIFVDDVIDAYIKAIGLMEKIGTNFVTFEIGSGKSISIRDFAGIIEKLTSKNSNINWGSRSYRKNEIFNSKADIKRSKELLNWWPKHSLNKGLKKTIEWYEQYRDITEKALAKVPGCSSERSEGSS